jgi:Holliday junction resolvase RusA-like endonuclease
MDIDFWLPGDPVPKARARVVRFNGGMRAYTPPETKQYETRVGWMAKQAMLSRAPTQLAVKLMIEFRLAMPRSWSQKRRDAAIAGLYVPTVKPDLTNLIKSIEDGMNGIVYRDDSQIVRLDVIKLYATTPGARVRVLELAEQPTPR